MRDPNDRILVVDGSGVDKIRTYHSELIERVVQNDKARTKANHKGGNRPFLNKEKKQNEQRP